MIQSNNQLTPLPFYSDPKYQDREKWWVDSLYRLASPDNKFLPFQIVKDITAIGGVTCPVPSTIDYTADFTTDVDGWEIREIIGSANAVLSWDAGNQRVQIVVTSNVGLTTLGVVVRKVRTGARYQYNAGSVNTTVRGTNALDELTAWSIPGGEKSLPTGTYINSGYTLVDSDTWDTSSDEYVLAFINTYTASTTFYIESFTASSTPYALLQEQIVYNSDFSSGVDSWFILYPGSANLAAVSSELVLTYNSETQVTIRRNLSYTTSSNIRRIKIVIDADQGFLYRIFIAGRAGGSSFGRNINVNHNFINGIFTYDVENDDNFGEFDTIELVFQPNGNLDTTISSIDFTTLDECIESSVNLWTTAALINIETGVSTDILTYMNANTGIATHENYQVAVYDASVNLDFTMQPGYYYIHLYDGTDNFYSDIFSPCSSLDGYLKLEWWSDTDIIFDNGRLVYQGGYINTLYLDTDVGKPTPVYQIEETERNGFKFVEKTVTFHRYRFQLIIPEYLVYILSRLPNHEHITIEYNDESFNVQKIDILEPEWEEQGDLTILEIEFETNTIITSGTRISGTVNELFANETEAINIRGNNKRIHRLSDTDDYTDVYLAIDKSTFSEAARIPIAQLLGAGGSLAVENKTARNNIPQESRSKHIIVSYDNNVQKYISSDLSNIAWSNDNNWVDIETFYLIKDDITARDAIPTNKRLTGLLVHVRSPYSWYQLVGGTTNNDWLEIQMPLTYPEETIPDSSVNYYLTVGTVAEHEVIRIEYKTVRNSNVEFGELAVTNMADTLIRWSQYGDNGLKFEKNIDSGNIRLAITDELADGNDIEIQLTIKRNLV